MKSESKNLSEPYTRSESIRFEATIIEERVRKFEQPVEAKWLTPGVS